MKFYSILIPPLAPATFYKKDGVYYHTQDPKHPKSLSRYIWNATTKTLDEIDDSETTNTIVCPLIMCLPDEVDDYVNNQFPFIEAECKSIYSEEEFLKVNIFVGHSDLQTDPVYIGLFAQKGIGEILWKKS